MKKRVTSASVSTPEPGINIDIFEMASRAFHNALSDKSRRVISIPLLAVDPNPDESAALKKSIQSIGVLPIEIRACQVKRDRSKKVTKREPFLNHLWRVVCLILTKWIRKWVSFKALSADSFYTRRYLRDGWEDGYVLCDESGKRLSDLFHDLGPSAISAIEASLTETGLINTMEKSLEDVLALKVELALSSGEIVAFPVDILIRTAPHTSRTRTVISIDRLSWLRSIGALPVQQNSTTYSFQLPAFTLSFWNSEDTSSYRHVTVSSSDRDFRKALPFLKDAIGFGYMLQVRLCSPSTKGEWIEVAHIETGNEGKAQGIHFGLSRKGQTQLVLTELDGEDLIPSISLLRKYQVGEEFLWQSNATHIVSPVAKERPNKHAYSIPVDEMQSIFESIAQGGIYSEIPLTELKTHIYRFYVDIDLPWGLYDYSPSFRAFKEAQHRFYAGQDTRFDELIGTLSRIYPRKKLETAISGRTSGLEEKSGYHVIFTNLLLRNDGRQGLFLAGYCEKLAVRGLLYHEDSIVRFLAHVINDCRAHVSTDEKKNRSPIIVWLLPMTVVRSKDTNIVEEMVGLCVNGIQLSLRSSKTSLNATETKQLVEFGIFSMGKKTLDKYFKQLKEAVTERARAIVLIRFARRCRWEILKRARYFDQEVYKVDVGLRHLGTIKPGDNCGRYFPLHGDLSPEEVSRHSISQVGGSVSQPTEEFSRVWRDNVKYFRYLPVSIDGLKMGFSLESRASYRQGLLELKLSSDEEAQNAFLQVLDTEERSEKQIFSLQETFSGRLGGWNFNKMYPYTASYNVLNRPGENSRIVIYRTQPQAYAANTQYDIYDLDVYQDSSGSVTIGYNDGYQTAYEIFYFDDRYNGWYGDNGSWFWGLGDMFDDSDGWELWVSSDGEKGEAFICHGGNCELVGTQRDYRL